MWSPSKYITDWKVAHTPQPLPKHAKVHTAIYTFCKHSVGVHARGGAGAPPVNLHPSARSGRCALAALRPSSMSFRKEDNEQPLLPSPDKVASRKTAGENRLLKYGSLGFLIVQNSSQCVARSAHLRRLGPLLVRTDWRLRLCLSRRGFVSCSQRPPAAIFPRRPRGMFSVHCARPVSRTRDPSDLVLACGAVRASGSCQTPGGCSWGVQSYPPRLRRSPSRC